jgi:hypothetical protein
MVKVFSKYAGRAIKLLIRDKEANDGCREVSGFLTSFKDKENNIFEINILTHEKQNGERY